MNFKEEVTQAVGDIGEVKRVNRGATLEVLNLECLSQEDEVHQVLNKVLKSESRKVTILGPNKRWWKFIAVVTDQEEAGGLESLGRIKIGFMRCPIRRRAIVVL